jgi:uncharacterized protein (DUF2147 family)
LALEKSLNFGIFIKDKQSAQMTTSAPKRERTMQTTFKTSILALLVLAGSGATALADPTGTWLRENGNSRVRVAACGSNLCGSIVWLKDATGPSKVGQRVFYDMVKSSDTTWSGQAFNPEDGKTYAGKMVVSGSSMTTSGCVLGGLICRSVKWSKVN